jgi:hypothetical protein
MNIVTGRYYYNASGTFSGYSYQCMKGNAQKDISIIQRYPTLPNAIQ